MSAYGAEESQLLGHLDVSKSKDDWSSLTLCPPRYKNEVQDKYLSVLGTPNLAFTIQIDSSPQEIKLNEPKTVDLPPLPPETTRVFQFIPTEDISDTQLDVTVTCESADVPAYLKVSRDCKDVKDNIDVVDYKGESLRLSFLKKGRITLSKVSIPPLTDTTSSWFIGIAIKNASGSTATKATKKVTLELSRSFDYSYAKPITVLVVVSTLLGVGISLFANFCFKKNFTSKDSEIELHPLLNQLEQGQQSSSSVSDTEPLVTHGSNRLKGAQQPLSGNASGRKSRSTNGPTQVMPTRKNIREDIDLISKDAEIELHPLLNQLEQGQQSSSGVPDTAPLVTLGSNRLKGAQQPLSGNATGNKSRSTNGPPQVMSTRKNIREDIDLVLDQEGNERAKVRTSTEGVMQPRSETNPLLLQQTPKNCCLELEAVLLHWFTRGPKTYSYTTGIMGFVLMIGAGQFVFANWHLMKEEGDRDNCYYNDFCYRVSDWHDIPLNLMISNLVYMIHGLILAGSVFYMEVKRLHEIRKSDTRQLPPKQAFSIGYAFAWALIFEGFFSLVYHLCPSKLTFQFDTAFMFVIAGFTVILLYNGIEMKECSGDGNAAKSPVGAGNFFLYSLVPLYIFNYLGTLRHSETGLPLLLETIFFSVLACWWVIITFWTGSKLGVVCSIEYFKEEPCKIFLFVLGVVAPVICFFASISNLPQAFLFACIAESVIASLGTGFCRDIKLKCSCLGTCCCRDITFRCSCMNTGFYRGIKFRCSCKDTDSSQGRRCKCSCLSFFQFLYVVLMGVLWGLALYYFLGKQVTDKVETPEKSRNLNHECTWLGFFDYHDIWHFLSSHGLLMMVYFVMFMSSA